MTAAAPARPRPSERVRAAYAALAAHDRPEVWIHLRPQEEVLADSAEVEALLAAGASLPLAGTVYAVKDNIDAFGLPTTAAHPAFAYRPERSATVVTRLAEAGAVLLGKTNMDQFATGLSGARSPYGTVRSAIDPDRVAGGSSSGSAAAVALGIVDFSLGTDTAGSGRVPAAFNEIVGVKPTPGLIPIDGVVPACASFDCVSVFAPDLATARTITWLLTAPSPLNPSGTPWPDHTPLAAPPAPRVALPRTEDLHPLSRDTRAAFDDARRRLEKAGAATEEIDLTPFLQAAHLLYGGGLVAERHAAFGEFLAKHPEGADPSVARIAEAAGRVTAAEYLGARQRLAALRADAEAALRDVDALLLPTAPEHPTVEAIAADPIGVNARLGTYTNFVNLFGMAAVAVPAGRTDGGCFGVTVVARGFADHVAADIAALLTPEYPATGQADGPGIPLVVFGAHLRGEPLNRELCTLGARFVGEVITTADYRMYLLPGSPPKPAVVSAAPGDGAQIPGEEWLLAPGALGRFLAGLPAPMSLGRVSLADGRSILGFRASVAGGEEDITRFGGWRAFRRARRSAPTTNTKENT